MSAAPGSRGRAHGAGGAGRPLRVAYLFNHDYFLGGGERSTAELIRSLDRARVEPLALVPGPGELLEHFKAAGVPVMTAALPTLRDWRRGAPLGALYGLLRLVRAEGVDVLHTGSTRACLYGGLAGRLAGVPVVWHVREALRDRSWYDRLLAGLAARLVCVSAGVRDQRLGGFGPAVTGKAVVVHNAVDTHALRRDPEAGLALRKTLGLDGGALLFGLVGNVIERKGHDHCVAALASVLQRDPRSAMHVLFIGRDDLEPQFAARVRGLASAGGVAGRVLFAPYTGDVVGMYSALDALVLPTRSEGFSRALIEAMSMELPVAASDLPEIREAVPGPENALLSPYGDFESLAKNMAALAGDPGLRGRMGAANRARAVAEFDLSSHAARVSALYRELAGGTR